MKSVRIMSCLVVMAFASASMASAQSKNPNCSPGEKGCSSNYPTSDVSKDNPTKNSNQDTKNPNCSPGEKGCSANYPTSGVSKDNPEKPK